MNTQSTRLFNMSATALSAILMLPVGAKAQVLEEIVVTAQKRVQSLSDVGISVSAFSGEQLRELNIRNGEELDGQIPGLVVTDYGGGTSTQFTIRGSAQLDFSDHQEAPVAVYQDDVYTSYLGGVGFAFFDLERVEVLRGPQGTLFGRNATGGLVHVISARPTGEPEGYVELSYGDFNDLRLEGAVSGALNDRISGRISALYTENDGFQENRIGDDLNNVENKSVRGQLLFEPDDEISFLLTGKYSTDDTNGQGYAISPGLTDLGGLPDLPGDGLVKRGTPAQHDAFCSAFFGQPFPLLPGATDCFGYTEPDNDPHTVSADEIGFLKRDHLSVSGTLDWSLSDSLRLVSITNWQDFEKRYREDVDATPESLFIFTQGMDSNQWSQEIRLHGEYDRWIWVGGVYYLAIDSDFQTTTDILNCCLVLFDNSYTIDTESYAAFGQTEFAISERLSLIAGYRWTEDKKDIDAVPTCMNAAPGDVLGLPADPCTLFFDGTAQIGPPLISGRSESDWSGVLEIDWRPNDDWLVYAKYSRGNKAGGYNAGATFLFDAATAFDFDGEVLHSYETGFKGVLFDGMARLNGSVFYYDYEDFQSFASQGPNLIVFNTDAENTGFEIELITNPAAGWEFLFGVSVQSAEQKDVEFAGDVRDRPMPNAPDLALNGLGRYEWSMFGGMMATQLDFNYVDERSLNGIDHPALVGDSYWLGNARLGYTTGDERWNFAVWVKNFTDEDYVATAFDITTFTGAPLDGHFGGL
jgi:iron complex outermembrane receptor protein